ncbi:two-component response regulator yesN [Lachnospiraceae bacterium KM106-2]|nr:two-component response regulator yesN [Lachnospiraceae bacterium KM106-2]
MCSYCKILIVDDELIMRKGIRHIIDWEQEGFEIVGEASNGKEALSQIETLKPDIIIADVVMPVLNGVDFSKILNEKYPNIQLIILSSYNDFNFVRSTLLNQAVDYILKPTLNQEELLKALKKAVLRIPGMVLKQDHSVHISTTLNRYLLGFENTLDLENLKQFFPHDSNLLFGMNTKEIYKNDNKICQDISQKLYLMLQGYTGYRFSPIQINDDILLFLINFPSNHDLSLYHDLSNAVSTLVKDYDRCFFLITPAFSSLLEIKHNYESEFLPHMNDYFYLRGNHVIQVKKCPTHKEEIPTFDMHHYQAYLHSFQFSDAIITLKQYIYLVVNEYQLEQMKLKVLTDNAIYSLISTLEDCKFDVYHLKLEYVSNLYNSLFADDFLALFEEMLEHINVILSTHQKNINDQIIHKIILYINNNYTKSLDLSEVASRFNFSYHYLSSYFSAHYKEGFNDYLNRLRIEKAKELLISNQDTPIAEIGSTVGYSDHSYFCKVFKKFTNYTPSKFKKVFTKE